MSSGGKNPDVFPCGCEGIVIAGTTEGRRVIEALLGRGWTLTVCVATALGREVLKDVGHPGNVRILSGRRDADDFERLFTSCRPSFVVDASHPFAQIVSKNVREAAQRANVPYIRFARQSSPAETNGCIYVPDAAAAAAVLDRTEGNILLTTGANTAAVYVRGVHGFLRRGYIRVLDTPASVQACLDAGIPGAHIIAGCPPFRAADNLHLIRTFKIETLVTKDSGSTGGLREKLDSAAQAGIQTVIIQRPKEPEGVPVTENVPGLLAWLDALPSGRRTEVQNSESIKQAPD